MAQIVGITKQQFIEQQIAAANQQYHALLKEYNDKIDKLTKKEWYDFVLMPVRFKAQLFQSGFSFVKDLLSGLWTTGVNFTNNMIAAFDNKEIKWDWTDPEGDAKLVLGGLLKGFNGLYVDTKESMMVAGVSLAANLTSPFTDDLDWAFGEKGLVTRINWAATRERLGNKDDTYRGPKTAMDVLIPYWNDFDTEYTKSNAEAYKTQAEEGIYDWAKVALEGGSKVANWTDEKIIEPTSEFLGKIGLSGVLELATGSTERMKTAYSEDTWYQVVNSMIDSLTRIGMTSLIGSLGAGLGMSPANAALMGQASYAISMYGRAFEEAVQSGTSYNDAHTYAWGIALTETITENLGGFVPGVAQFDDLMSNKTWTELLGTIISEGGEEALADLMGTGFDVYLGEGEIDRPSNEEFWEGVGISALSGALTGILGSAGQNLLIHDVVDNKLKDLNEQLQTELKVGEEGTFLSGLNKKIMAIVKLLNKENLRFVSQDSKGNQKISNVTDGKTKVAWLRRSGLNAFIDAKYNEDGTVKFSLNEKGRNLNVNSFSPTVDGKPIVRGEYAISQKTFAVEMKNGEFSPVELKTLNENELKLYNVIKDSRIPIALVSSEDASFQGAYVEEGGVIYLNKDAADMTPEHAANIVATHEIVHYLKDSNPVIFNALKDELNKFVKLDINEKGKFTGVTFTDRTIENLINKAEPNFISLLTKQLNEYAENALKEKLSKEEFADRVREEVATYLLEHLFRDSQALQAAALRVSSINDLYKALKKDRKAIKEKGKEAQKEAETKNTYFGNRRTIKALNTIEMTLAAAVQQASIRNAIAHYIVSSVFGRQVKKSYYDAYGQFIVDEEIKKALVSGEEFVTLGGEQIKFTDLFENYKGISKGQTLYRKTDVIEGYSEANKQEYLNVIEKTLKNIEKLAEKQTDKAEAKKMRRHSAVFEAMRYDINNGVNPFTEDTEGKSLFDEYGYDTVDIRSDLYALYRDQLITKKPTLTTDDVDIRFTVAKNLVNKFYTRLQKTPYFRDYSTAISGIEKSASIRIGFNVDSAEVAMRFIDFSDEIADLRNLFDFNAVEKTINGNNIIEVIGTPKPDVVTQLAETYERQKRTKVDETQATKGEETKVLTTDEAKQLNKYYTDTVLSNFVADKVVEFFKGKLNLKELNIYEPMAGVGNLVESLMNKGLTHIIASDIMPESTEANDKYGIKKEDFFKLKINTPYNENVVITNPPFSSEETKADTIAKIINHAIKKIAPVYVGIHMNSLQTYTRQSKIDQDIKLVFNLPLGRNAFTFDGKTELVNVVLQVWVDRNDSRFANMPDLRLTKAPSLRSHDFQIGSVRLWKEDSVKKFEKFKKVIGKENSERIIYIPKVGTDKTVLTDITGLKNEYIYIYAKNDETFELLKNMNFERIAQNTASFRMGDLTVYEVVAEYNRVKRGYGVYTNASGVEVKTEKNFIYVVGNPENGTYNFVTELEAGRSNVMIIDTNDYNLFKPENVVKAMVLQDVLNDAKTRTKEFTAEWANRVKNALNNAVTLEQVRDAYANTTDDRTFMQALGYDGVNNTSFEGMNSVIYSIKPETIIERSGTVVKPFIAYRKSNIDPKTEQEMRTIFGADVTQLFDVNPDGKFVLKSKFIKDYSTDTNRIKIRGVGGDASKVVEYSGNEYAINLTMNFENITTNADFSRDIKRIIKLSDFSETERAYFDFFKSTGLNFIVADFYKESWGGVSYRQYGNVIFISRNNFNKGSMSVGAIAETLFHEHVHEIYKFNQEGSIRIGILLTKLMYEGDDLTTLGKKLFAKKNFVETMRTDYGSRNINGPKTLKAVLDFTENGVYPNATIPPEYNELVAQISGVLFSDTTLYKEMFSELDTTDNIEMYNVFTGIFNDPKTTEAARFILEDLSKVYKEEMKIYLATAGQLFSKQTSFSEQELDDFINSFTDGKYKTKRQLLAVYLIEKGNGKIGEATETLNSIIFVASLFAPTVQTAQDNFTRIKNEFEEVKKMAERILGGSEEVFTYENNQGFKELYKYLKENEKITKLAAEDYDLTKLNEMVEQTEKFIEVFEGVPEDFFVFNGLESKDYYLNALRKHLTYLIDAYDVYYKPMTDAERNDPDVVFRTNREASRAIKTAIGIIYRDMTSFFKIEKGEVFKEAFLKDIKKLRVAYRKEVANTLLNALNKRYKTVMEESQRRVGGPLAENIKKATTSFKNLNEKVKDFRDGKLSTVELGAFVHKTLQELNSLLIANEGNFDDKQVADIKQAIIDVYHHFGAFLDLKGASADTYITNAGDAYNTANAPKKNIVYKPNVLANKVKRLVSLFATEYTLIFDRNERIVDYVKKVKEEYRDNPVIRKGGQPPQLGFGRGIFAKLIDSMWLPQDYFSMLSSVFPNSSFFKNFEEQYHKSAMFRNLVRQQYMMFTEDFHKKNKNAHKNAVETVEVDRGKLSLFSATEIQRAREEAKTLSGDAKDELTQLTKNRAENRAKLKKLKEELRIKRQVLKELKSKKTLTKTEETRLNKEIVENKIEQIELSKLILEATTRIKVMDAGKDADYDFQYRKQLVILQEAQATKETTMTPKELKEIRDSQKLMRGELVSLYMSLQREQEMHDSFEAGESDVNPTNHLEYGSEISIFNQKIFRTHGFEAAKSNSKKMIIFAEGRKDLIAYIETLLNADDYIAIEYARAVFDMNYAFADSVYYDAYQVNMPKQYWYIPFESDDGNLLREMNLKLRVSNRQNDSFEDSFVTETTLGAHTTLRIDNVFGIAGRHTDAVANYHFAILLKDFQSILQNSVGGEKLQSMFEKDEYFGKDANILNRFTRIFRNVLQYADVDGDPMDRFLTRYMALQNGTILAFNLWSFGKQFFSVFTASIKDGLNPLVVSGQVAAVGAKSMITLSMNDKAYLWMMKNNPAFYNRVKSGNLPQILDSITAENYMDLSGMKADVQSKIRQINEVLTKHLAWADTIVLVAAFRTEVERLQKKYGDTKSEAEIYEMANKKLNNMLLYSVASVDSAYRSTLSQQSGLVGRTMGRMLSEPMLHASAFMKRYLQVKNGVMKWTDKAVWRDVSAYVLVAFLNALFGLGRDFLEGKDDDKDNPAFEFFVNDLIWESIIGGIPYLSFIASSWELDLKTGYRDKYSLTVPLFSEVKNVLTRASSLRNGVNVGGKWVALIESLATLIGLPLKNVLRVGKMVNYWFAQAGNENAIKLDDFLNLRSEVQSYNRAIDKGNTKRAEVYLDRIYTNTTVKTEIIRLQYEGDGEVNPRFGNTFKSLQKDGTYKTYTIPEKDLRTYRNFAQKAVEKATRSSEYRKLNDKQKTSVVQRIINYFYNYLKKFILDKKSNPPLKADSIIAVAEQALKYETNKKN